MKRCVGTCIDALLLLQLKFVKALQVATETGEQNQQRLSEMEEKLKEAEEAAKNVSGSRAETEEKLKNATLRISELEADVGQSAEKMRAIRAVLLRKVISMWQEDAGRQCFSAWAKFVESARMERMVESSKGLMGEYDDVELDETLAELMAQN